MMVTWIWHQKQRQRRQKPKSEKRIHQTKIFCTAKETINKVKMQSAKWEKIFVNHIFDKGLIIQNIKRTHTLNSKKKKKIQLSSSQRIWIKRRHISGQQVHQMVLKVTNILEMQIKTTMRYHLTPIKMTTVRQTRNNSVGEGIEKWEPFVHCYWECKLA